MKEKYLSSIRLVIIGAVTLLVHLSENKIGLLLPTMLPLIIEWYSIGFSKELLDYSILLTYFILIHFYLWWLKTTTVEVVNIVFKK